MIQRRAARVRVPCSTSNLGAGFDVLGLALDCYLSAVFEPGDDGLHVRRSGTLEGLDVGGGETSAREGRTATHGSDLLVRMFSEVVAGSGADLDGELIVHSDIPVARGLGSSAAALVAGHDLARAVLDLPTSPEQTFRAAARNEGHGDNAAPCVFGGLQAVFPGPGGLLAHRLEISPTVGFAYAAPAGGLSTHEARAALPRTVTHEVAVAGLGRLLALTRGLAEGDGELIAIGFRDELHVPYRMPLIPGAEEAVRAGCAAGAWAVTTSGSGSGLIAACPLEVASDVAHAMHEVFSGETGEPGCVGFALQPDLEGIRRT